MDAVPTPMKEVVAAISSAGESDELEDWVSETVVETYG